MKYNGPSVRNGDRVTGDARPSEVITYQLPPEEIAARYGPPKKEGGQNGDKDDTTRGLGYD